MKILFLMIAYPQGTGKSNMYTDLASEFVKNGHEVYVAAPSMSSTGMYIEDGINVLRIRTLPLFNVSILIKGIANLLLPYLYKIAISKYFKNVRFDSVVTPTPPITFTKTASFLKKKYNSTIYLILRDIFPQNAKDLGLINSKLIFWYFRKREKELYRAADQIGCMSQRNIDYIRLHNPEVNPEKLHLLPNWTKVETMKTTIDDIKTKYGLDNKFVAVFGGNFGLPQKIEFLIEVAEKIQDKKDILFLFVGDGTEKVKIRNLVIHHHLTNVRIIDQLTRDEYSELLSGCDLGLVNLSDKFTIPNIPSRTLAYWLLKIPVLAAIDKNTDFGEILDESGGGLWSLMGNTDNYIANLITLYENQTKRKQMGENGYNYLITELNSEKAFNTILNHIQ